MDSVENYRASRYNSVMFRTILLHWLASQITPEVQANLQNAATDALRDAVAPTPESDQTVEAGFVFADPREYGCLLDRMNSVRVTRGGGFKYSDGRLGSSRLVIVESGIGATKAAAAAEALIQVFRPKRIISAGFAAGLVPSLERNRIVLSRRIIQRATGETLDLWQKLLEGPMEETSKNSSKNGADSGSGDPLDKKYAAGTLLTSDELIEKPSEKKRLAEQFGASLADMETFAVAAVCRSAGVPFLSVRVIFDSVNETMPGDLKILADAAQKSAARTLGAFFGAVTRRPSSLLDMYQLKENALVAADKLADALVDILAMKKRR